MSFHCVDCVLSEERGRVDGVVAAVGGEETGRGVLLAVAGGREAVVGGEQGEAPHPQRRTLMHSWMPTMPRYRTHKVIYAAFNEEIFSL